MHTGLSPFSGPALPLPKWKFQTGGSILSSPTVAFGTIYVGSDDGNLYALSRDGALKWKFTTGGAIESSPAVARDGTIYVESDGYLYAIRPSGRLEWKLNIIVGSPTSSPTVGSDGTIYVGGATVEYPGQYYGLYAVRPNGTVKWVAPAGAETYDSPAIGSDGTLYIGIDDPSPTGRCGDCLEAVYPNGTIKWGANTGGAENSSPVVATDGTIFYTSIAVRPDGTIKWNLAAHPGETWSSPGIGQHGTIYAASSQIDCLPNPPGCSWTGTTRLYAVRPDGSILWRFSVTNNLSGSQIFCCIYGTVSSPAIDANGIVYMGGVDGNMYAVRPNGTLLWKFALGGAIGSSPAIDLDRTIYVGSTDGNLYAIGTSA
jgi:outer membrane protein assembly factor BamB